MFGAGGGQPRGLGQGGTSVDGREGQGGQALALHLLLLLEPLLGLQNRVLKLRPSVYVAVSKGKSESSGDSDSRPSSAQAGTADTVQR